MWIRLRPRTFRRFVGSPRCGEKFNEGLQLGRAEMRELLLMHFVQRFGKLIEEFVARSRQDHIDHTAIVGPAGALDPATTFEPIEHAGHVRCP